MIRRFGPLASAASLLLVLCGAALTVGAQRTSSQTAPPDVILTNGRFITVDRAFSRAEAAAITGGRFVAVGTTAEIDRLKGPSTRSIDLHGRSVVPGLGDNHLHNAGGGPGIALSGARSLDDVYRAIAARVNQSEPGELLVSNSDWHEAQLREQRLPLRRDLDRVAPANPVVLVRGGHEYILNSAALRKWNIGEQTPEPAGGRISRYDDKTLNGELVDRARNLVALPPPPPRTIEERIAAQAAEYRTLHASGLTSVRHPGISPDDYRVLQEMQRRGLLTMRVNALLRPDRELDAPAVSAYLANSGVRPDEGDAWLRIGGVKLAIDGGFEGGFMRDPYLEPWGEGGTYRGLQTVPAARYTAIVRAINAAGWRVATHAVGDAAIDQVLDAYEAADRDRSIRGRRWSIEHAFIARADHFPRMRALGLAISAQDHLYLAGPSLLQYWGKERTASMTPMRTFIDQGLMVSAGTDSSVVPFPPLWVLYHFITRDTISGGVIGPEQRITREEALRASTMGNASLTFEEEAKGSIEPGKLADLVVLSEDILSCPEERIESAKVLLTMVGGKVVYAGEEFPAEVTGSSSSSTSAQP
ncbi:MAG: amidohydrolase [Vicinamibacterales bacterium]